MKLGVVGTKGGWSSEKLVEAVAARNEGYCVLIEMDKVRLDLARGRAFFNNLDLSTLDGLIIKKIGARYSPDLLDRLEILHFLNEQGLAMWSLPRNIMRVLDRLSCTVNLRLAGIPMPPTTITESPDEALFALEEYKTAVFKPLFTSKARGMKVISAGPQAREQVEDFHRENKVLYIQKKIELNGLDLGLSFLGGKYLTTYARESADNSWNTTIASGGKYAPYDPPDSVIELARRAQEPFGLVFTCVDVAITHDGPMVFEVSAFGGFRGMLEARQMDASKLLADYVINETVKGQMPGGRP